MKYTLALFLSLQSCFCLAFSDCTNDYKALLKLKENTEYQCITISKTQDFVSTAQKSNEEVYESPLKLYLIKSNKVISSITSKKMIPSDAVAFDGLKFEKINYSAQEQTIVGLDIHHSHLGASSYSQKTLNLYEIKNAKINEILVSFPIETSVHESAQLFDGCSLDSEGSQIKANNILIISTQNNFAHADLMIKSKKIEIIPSGKRCIPIQKIQKSQTILKFNGHKYIGNLKQLLTLAPI